MTISGADIGRLTELGQSMDGAAESIRALRGRLDASAGSLAWSGPDRERFSQDWLGRFSPALAAIGQALETAAAGARGNAEQQERASGAGSGQAPGGAAPVAGGAAAPAGGGDDADRYGEPTGALSARYESRGGVGTVSTGVGDSGGVSYGTYQLATTRGTPGDFVAWAQEHHPQAHARLDGLAPGSAAFSARWRELAAADPAGFGAAQHDFIVQSHYRPGVDRIVARVPELTLAGRADVVADVIWSTTVQHGAGGAATVFANALRGEDVAAMSDADLIRAVYAERGRDDGMAYFSRNSDNVRAGVVARFPREQADALAQLPGAP